MADHLPPEYVIDIPEYEKDALVIPSVQFPEAYRFKRQEILDGTTPGRIRRQHCTRCNHVLAEEAGPTGAKTATESRYITHEIGIDGEFRFKPGRWWGNWIVCPYCGNEGRLPIDKPLRED